MASPRVNAVFLITNSVKVRLLLISIVNSSKYHKQEKFHGLLGFIII